MPRARRVSFAGAEGNVLAGDFRDGEGPRVALMLHGGGQTRHSWEGAARRLAGAGWRVLTVDQRGHGASDRSAAGHYSYGDFAGDTLALGREVARRYGAAPVAIGASLGGISALLAQDLSGGDLFSGLVLVDVTPRMERSGVERIQRFMAARMHDGFASVEDAAASVAAYLPHRKRPRSSDGLRKNLRRDPDGRYRWHWDPRFLDGPRPISTDSSAYEERRIAAARRLKVPTLLVRGQLSDLVGEAQAEDFRRLVPHAAQIDVGGAGHMVAGDRNDVFADAVLDFLAASATDGEPARAGRGA